MGEIVSGVASALLEKLATKAYQEIVLACGLKGDVEKLREKMDFIAAYLVDAENKQLKQPKERSITKWLQQLKEAFFDASDILDEIECETLRNQVVKEYASAIRKVRRFFSCSNPLAFRIKMSRKIRDIRDRINEIASIRGEFDLVVMDHRRDDQSLIQTLSWRETHSDLPSRVTGRDREKERIINDLMRPNLKDNKIDVIPIVGIGGLGKTTLAQLAYNDKSVVDKFPLRMWVCVSVEFEIKRLMMEILKAADRTIDVQSSSLDEVKTLLREALHGKKFLLVLDDVWNEDAEKWQQLEDVLLGLVDEGKKDSKIIVTTRSNNVVSIMGNVSPHNLEELPKKECLELFFKCAFPKGEEEKHPNLKEIGDEIVEKCKGVPLAVKTLGCLLYSRYDKREWKDIRDSELWELDQSKEGTILPALKLSYNHLPPQLKKCFSLCSIFPKDYEYYSFELVSFWMAHGLLQPKNDKEEPEYVGELYIRKLIAISFLQYDYDDKSKLQEVLRFGPLKMHDLVHDLALSMMISEQAIVINDSKLVNEKVRHLFFSNNTSSLFSLKLNKVQTIISRERDDDGATNFVNWICNQFKNIKVLDFSNSDFQFLPDCLGKMKHLRYLNLTDCSSLEKLPDSICKLQSLHVLWLGGCEALKNLPSNMGKYLVSLRSLAITAQVTDLSTIDIGHFKYLQFLVIGACDNLVSLPRDLKNLTSLKMLAVAACSELVRFEDIEDENEGKKTEVVNDFSLHVLIINNLPKLTALPNWLTRYATTSLEILVIKNCPDMSSLPADMDSLCNLQHLYIVDCPGLEEKCKDGPERTKIAHVTNLHFQDEDSEEGEAEEHESEEAEDKEEA